MSGIGGFGSYRYGKLEEGENKLASDKVQNELNAQTKELQANTSRISDKTELIFQALKVKTETWMEVEMKNVPPGVTDYLLLLFTSDKGGAAER